MPLWLKLLIKRFIYYLLGKNPIKNIHKDENEYQSYNHKSNLLNSENKQKFFEIYIEIANRDDICTLFDKIKDLSPRDVEYVLMFVQAIRQQRGLDDYNSND